MIYYKSDFERKEKKPIELGKGYIRAKNVNFPMSDFCGLLICFLE